MAEVVFGDAISEETLAVASRAVLDGNHSAEAEVAAVDAMAERLAETGLPVAPFAAFLDRLPVTVAGSTGRLAYLARHAELQAAAGRAAAADTIGPGPFTPVLSDWGWLALQNICDEQEPL